MNKINDKINEFSPNNIGFRISSTKIMERFKQTQNFLFVEMEYGTYPFNRTSKEIALLYTDRMFSWLVGLEAFIIKNKYLSELTKEQKDGVSKSFFDTMNYICDITKQHADLFDPTFVSVWKEVRFPIEEEISELFSESKHQGTVALYTDASNLIIESIEEMRLDLYEIDYLKNGGERPFLCITDQDSGLLLEGDMRIVRKANMYIDVYKCKSFILKNYSTSTSFFNKFQPAIQAEISVPITR